MPPTRKTTQQGPSTITWTGDNFAEVSEFCGLDRLQQPRANQARFWDGQPLLSVWTPVGTGDRETTLPVRVGETVVRDAAGRLSVLGADLSAYEPLHVEEAR